MRASSIARLVPFLVAASLVATCSGSGPTSPLSRYFTVTGVVREKWGQGSPVIPFAQVMIVGGAASGTQTRADANGQFRFDRLAREGLEVRAWTDDFESSVAAVSPSEPTVQILLEPRSTLFSRTFVSPVPSGDRRTIFDFTVRYAGPATLRLRTNRYDEDAGDVGGIFVFVRVPGTNTDFINADNGTQPSVWRTWSAVLKPATYRFDLSVRFDSPTPGFYVRDVEFSYPR